MSLSKKVGNYLGKIVNNVINSVHLSLGKQKDTMKSIFHLSKHVSTKATVAIGSQSELRGTSTSESGRPIIKKRG